MSKRMLVVFVLAFLCVTANAQVYNWTTYTNKDEITSLTTIGGDVWATTTGGLVRINATTSAVKTYIKSDGLGSTDLLFVTYAGDSIAYVGSSDGVLSKVEIEDGAFTNHYLQGRDGANIELYNADTSAGYLWIGSSIGIIKFDRNRNGGEVKEIYRTLGDFSTELPVYDVAIFHDKIYAATPEGLAYADFGNPYLLDPNEWRNAVVGKNDSLTALAHDAATLYIGGSNALAYAGSDTNFFDVLSPSESARVYDMREGPDGVIIVADIPTRNGNGLWGITDAICDALFVPLDFPYRMNSAIVSGGVFVGTSVAGVFRFSTTDFTRIPVPGPTSNNLVGGGVSGDGYLYSVSKQGDVARMKNDNWETLTAPNVEKTSAAIGADSSLWVGTFGQGAIQYFADGTSRRFHGANSPLTGPNYYPAEVTVVNGVSVDPAGRTWFSSYQASPMRPLVMFDSRDSSWTYFDAADGVIDSNVTCVAAGRSSVALGTLNLGVMLVRYGEEPIGHGDDTVKYYSRSVRLPSATVNAMIYDRTDTLWVGTPLGLAYFDAEIDFFFVVSLPEGVSSDVRALATDTRNNLWVGTANGLAFISKGQTQKLAFTTANSELVSNEIQGLSFDNTSGHLLVFTKGGLSVLDYSLGPTDSAATVYPYPNPFVIQIGVDVKLQFKFNQRADVRIFTAAGELVRKFEVSEGWDGRNESGELVASGVYVYYLLGEDKTQHTGKIFVLRK